MGPRRVLSLLKQEAYHEKELVYLLFIPLNNDDLTLEYGRGRGGYL